MSEFSHRKCEQLEVPGDSVDENMDMEIRLGLSAAWGH